MYGEGPSIYQKQKLEAKQVMNRIRSKHYQEVQSERLEGLLIADDLRDELRRNYKRGQTQKLFKRIRQRQMTYQYRKSLKQEKIQTAGINQLQGKTSSERKSITINQRQLVPSSRRLSARHSSIKKNDFDQIIKEVVLELKTSQKDIKSQASIQSYKSQEDQVSNQGLPQIMSLNYTECKSFLPMLELYIEQRLFLKTMSSNQKKIHSIIIQMMLLALARRNNNKILEALDILIQIDRYFPKKSSHLKQLKAVWYLLIGKFYYTFKKDEKQQQKQIRWRKQSQVQLKPLMRTKRQRSIMIKSIASKRNFMNRILIQMQKLGLVFETTYQKQLSNTSNFIQQGRQERLLIAKINKQYVLAFPEPSAMFKSQSIMNYTVVVVHRDKDSCLFPNYFSNSLALLMSKTDYKIIICKINSILIPENRSFSYNSVLNANFQSIFCFFLFLLLTAGTIIFLIKRSQLQGIFISLIVAIIIVIMLSSRIHFQSNNSIGKTNELYNKIKQILQQWSDKYQQNSVKFTLSQNAQIIIISFAKTNQQSLFGSQARMQSQNSLLHKSKRISINQEVFSYKTGPWFDIDQADKVIQRKQSSAQGGPVQLIDYQSQAQSNARQLAQEQPSQESSSKDSAIENLQKNGDEIQVQTEKQQIFVFNIEGDEQISANQIV